MTSRPIPQLASRASASPIRPTPLALRVYRWTRTIAHVLGGVAMTAIIYPRVAPARRDTLTAAWSRRLLRILRIEARVHGFPAEGLPGNLLIVANHISWLDIFVLSTVQPARFIAKAELKHWPLVGRFAKNVGTLFIDRARRHDTHKINQHAADALAGGDVIAIFPEGTTSDGRDLLPFHGSLLQPIVDTGGQVQPIGIRYLCPDGGINDAPAYIGATTFMQSFWRVTGERAIIVELHLAPLLPARARHRRELSRAAEAAIRTALALPANDSAPDTRGDPPA